MKINDVAHFSLSMGTNTYILQTHTQRQHYEVQVVFRLNFEVLHCNIRSILRGREDMLFLGKVRSSPSGTSPAESRAPSGLSDACCCEDQITDGGGSTQTGSRAARKNSRATTAVPVSYTHLRAHETRHDLVCRLLLEKKKE